VGVHSVAVGYNSAAEENGVFSVGYAGGERKIVNVAEGAISADSTDSVTGGQLFTVRRALDALAATNGVK
jgi:autotransporter adhesin